MFSQTLTHGNSKNEIRQAEEDGKKRRVSMERSKAGTNKRSPDGLSHPNQNPRIINKYGNIFYKKWKKYNEIQLTKSKMDLKIQKMTNHLSLPVTQYLS